jgi:hypothetical protein
MASVDPLDQPSELLELLTEILGIMKAINNADKKIQQIKDHHLFILNPLRFLSFTIYRLGKPIITRNYVQHKENLDERVMAT